MLTVHLEETDCFAAWVSAREVGIGQPSVESSDPKRMFLSVVLNFVYILKHVLHIVCRQSLIVTFAKTWLILTKFGT